MKHTAIIPFLVFFPILILCQDVSSVSSKKIRSDRIQEFLNHETNDFIRHPNFLDEYIKSQQGQKFSFKSEYDEGLTYEQCNNDKIKLKTKRTLLENSYLLIEINKQKADGANWINDRKYLFTYNENDLMIERLKQNWDGIKWVYNYKYAYAYDDNENDIEELFFKWDSTKWLPHYKWSKMYDDNNILTEELNQYWENTTWVNSWRYLSTYDANNNRTEWIEQDWDGNDWVDNSKLSYTYDSNNNLIKEEGFECIVRCGQIKYLYSYDSNNNLIELIEYSFTDTTMYDTKYSWTYDDNNKLIEERTQHWNDLEWVNGGKYLYKYDDNNNQTEALTQYWEDSIWVNDLKDLCTYDERNNMTDYIGQRWENNSWVNKGRFSSTFDINNNLIEQLEQDWDGVQWINDWMLSQTYDVNDNKIEELYQDWDGAIWVNIERSIYSYSSTTNISPNLPNFESYKLAQNYPNPFNPSTTIEFTLPKSEFTILKVYNILGQEVVSLVSKKLNKGNHTCHFDGNNLASGIYYYQLVAGEYRDVNKMILLK